MTSETVIRERITPNTTFYRAPEIFSRYSIRPTIVFARSRSQRTQISCCNLSFVLLTQICFFNNMSVATASKIGACVEEGGSYDPVEHEVTSQSADAPSLIPDRWRKTLESARPALRSNSESRQAFKRLITDATLYGTGLTSIIPDLNASNLTRTPELKRLRDMTGNIMCQARGLSQSEWSSDEQLRRVATELNEEWQRTVDEVEQGGAGETEKVRSEHPDAAGGATGSLGSDQTEDKTDTDANTSAAVTTIPSEGDSSTSHDTAPAAGRKWPKARVPTSKRTEPPNSDSTSSDASSQSPLDSAASFLKRLANLCGAVSSLAESTRRPIRCWAAPVPSRRFTYHRHLPHFVSRVSMTPPLIPATRTVTIRTTRHPVVLQSVW